LLIVTDAEFPKAMAAPILGRTLNSLTCSVIAVPEENGIILGLASLPSLPSRPSFPSLPSLPSRPSLPSLHLHSLCLLEERDFLQQP